MIRERDLPPQLLDFLTRFREKHGRSLRVLHIGNIANNAYVNAKLLNKVNLDCDVICYNYYHIMGCPEWEDADFEGEVGDHFYPNWKRVKLNGFVRPKWFAQGPYRLCIHYLLARREGRKLWSRVWWFGLELSQFVIAICVWLGLKSYIRSIKKWGAEVLRSIAQTRYTLQTYLKDFFVRRGSYGEIRYTTQHVSFEAMPLEGRVEGFLRDFPLMFQDRKDKLTLHDLEPYMRMIGPWENLFGHYDIIQAYSTDTILPLLAGKEYLAFEHGTLRDIPFQNSTEGRLSALSYRCAQHVFVTNADCIKNARTLVGDRFTFINHPFDEDHGLGIEGWKALRKKLQKRLDAEHLIFFPTRHDWILGKGYADKGNDLFLRSFCRLLGEGVKLGMVCCRWGSNVEESIELLKSYGCDDCVLWVQPMGSISFERTAKACHITADQFKLGSFGGVMFKAMAVGAPICTYLDDQQMLNRYGEIPPVINCRSEEEIVLGLSRALKEKGCLENLGRLGRDWITTYHSSRDTIAKEIEIYREHLASRKGNVQ
jgi:hypothetical protein